MEEYERKFTTINKEIDLMSSNLGGHNSRGAREKTTEIEWKEIKGNVRAGTK